MTEFNPPAGSAFGADAVGAAAVTAEPFADHPLFTSGAFPKPVGNERPILIHQSARYRLETEGIATYVVWRLPRGLARKITEMPECLAVWRRLRDIDARGGCKDLLCRNILEGRLPL